MNLQVVSGLQGDKNIYDGRRGNNTTQPMEMSALLTTPGNTTPGTGTLSSKSSRTSNNRICPQYTIKNVKLLQELGEGAFGTMNQNSFDNNW